MAKGNRFPSPANVAVDKKGKPVPVKAEPKGPLPAPVEIKGEPVKTVEIHYKGENHVILHNGVHHLAKGLNHVPGNVWKESKKTPHIAHLIKEGKITEPADEPIAAAAESDDEDDAPASCEDPVAGDGLCAEMGDK